MYIRDMKKLIYAFSIFLPGIFLTMNAQQGIPHVIGTGGQSDSPSVTFTVGQSFIANHHDDAGFLNLLTLPEDTLFIYEIGSIPDKVVRHNSVCRFRFFWPENPSATYSYQVNHRNDTNLTIVQENASAIFQYDPLPDDFTPFQVEFTAQSGENTVSQTINFTPVPDLLPEQDIIRYLHGEITFDTIVRNLRWRTGAPMNFSSGDSLATIDLIGKTVVFENGNVPFTWDMSNLERLNVFATTIIVRDAVTLPQTEVYLYCEDLIFEDTGPEHSSFNTTPKTPPPDITGMNGLRAGDLHVYAKKVIAAGTNYRFYLNGGKGSAENQATGAAPGGGGDAGDLYSNLNQKSRVSLKGGLYQSPVDWEDNYPLGTKGEDGKYIFEDQPFKWLHPNAVRLMLQYAREKYIYGEDEKTLEISEKFISRISSYKKSQYWDADTINRLDLEQLLYSYAAMKEQVENNLDYYGNPKGWAPLLSFEANLENYENEVEYAIRVLYLNYWLSNEAEDLQDLLSGAKELKERNATEIGLLQQRYAEASAGFGPNLARYKILNERLDSLSFVYDQKIVELLTKATNKVENSWESKLRKAGFIAGQICKFIPGTVTQVIGSELQTAASFDYEDPLSMDNWNKVHETLNVALDEYATLAENASEVIGKMDPAAIASAATRQARHNSEVVLENMSPENLQKIGSAIRELTIPEDRVKAEFERLRAVTPILNDLTEAMEDLTLKKGIVARDLAFSRYQLTSLPGEITRLLLACDAMDDIILGNENIVDPRALSHLNEMNNSAWERLLKYHYYLAGAYQYRFLKAYEKSLNMQPFFDSFEAMAVHNAKLSSDQYQALLPVFQDQLKEITDEMYDQFNTGTYNEYNAPIRYTLNNKQLGELNTNGQISINIWEDGKVPLQNSDSRITEISIDPAALQISQDTILSDASLTMLFAHSGKSMLINRNNARHYMFSQYNKDAALYYNTNNMSPLGWGEVYFFINQELNTVNRSLASQSLMRKILNNAGDDDFMVFTRPAAWSDVRISTSLFTGEQTRMQFSIESMTLIIKTDYQPVTTFSNILLNTSDGLMPLIHCSEADKNGRYHGWGNFTRSYDNSSSPVHFTAPQEYGIYKFDKWIKTTNGNYEEISTNSISVNPGNHSRITAQYRKDVPELSVPDTLYAEWSQTSIDIPVNNRNVTQGKVMDWFSETTGSWITIKEGTDTGEENGTITLLFSTNEGDERTEAVTVFAFDASNPEKKVVVIQSSIGTSIEPVIPVENLITIYPVPASEEIRISLPGNATGKNGHITILAADGRSIYSHQVNDIYQEQYIGLTGIKPGVYILKVIVENKIYIRRFIKL